MKREEDVTSEPTVKREETTVAVGLWKSSDDVLDEFSACGAVDDVPNPVQYPNPNGLNSVVASFLRGHRLTWAMLVAGTVLAFTVGYLVAMTGLSNHVRSVLSDKPIQTTLLGSSLKNSPVGAIPTKGVTATNVLVVDVQGDVLHPGIVHLGPNARVMDAVAAAGGFKHPDDASRVNLAAPVNDGDEVVIPYNVRQTEGVGNVMGEQKRPSGSLLSSVDTTQSSPVSNSPVAGTGNSLIDLNTADEATLETIPGIGPSKASSIIAYRNAHGPFLSVNDLLSIHGIGAVTLSHIAPYVTIIGGQ